MPHPDPSGGTSPPSTSRELLDLMAAQVRDLAKAPDHVLADWFPDLKSVHLDLADTQDQVAEHVAALAGAE